MVEISQTDVQLFWRLIFAHSPSELQPVGLFIDLILIQYGFPPSVIIKSIFLIHADRRGSSLTAQYEWQGLVCLGATVVQEVEKSFSNLKVASSIPCGSVLEQDTEPLIAPGVPSV